MPETNFLTQMPGPENIKKPRKKVSRKTTPSSARADKSLFKLKDNLNIKSAMPKPKLKIEKDSSVAKKGEAKNIYRKFAFSFIALTIILVFAVLYFGFSKVTLIIVPTQEKITGNLNISLFDKDKTNKEVYSGLNNYIVGLVGTEWPVEQEETFRSSGRETLGEEVSGKVTIINNYLKNQPLVATTRLLSQNNKLFRLKNTVNVPAGGQVEAEVYADEASPSMAIGPSRFTIPGLWAGIQDKIYAESKESMRYSEKVKITIKQEDIDTAVKELKDSILKKAQSEITYMFSEDFDQVNVELDNNTISQEVNGKVGEEKMSFSIKMKAKARAVAFDINKTCATKYSDCLYDQVKKKIKDSIADDKEILEFNPSDISYKITDVDLSRGTAMVNVDYTAKVTLKDNTGIIKKNNLAGLNLEQVKAYLKSLPEVAGYEIKFFPSFIKKMPNLVDRIEIVIKR